MKPRKCIGELEPYGHVLSDGEIAEKYGISLGEVKRFDRNTSPGVLGCVKRELGKIAEEGIGNEYPDSRYVELTGLLAEYCGAEPGQVVLGNGADEAIDLVVRAYLPEGGAAVASTPTFSFYKVVVSMNGGRFAEVPRREDFSLDGRKLLEAAKENDAKIMFVCNPNNPTGNLTPPEEIEGIAEGFGGLLVVDEAYIEFAGEGNGGSAVGLCEKCGNVVVIRTLSKAFGLAGMRVGYMVCPKEVAGELNKMRQPYNINAVSMRLAVAALGNRGEMEENVGRLVGERERVAAELAKMGLRVFPSSTNFVLVEVGDAEGAFERLAGKGLVVRKLGGGLGSILRITVRGRGDNDLLLGELAKEAKGGEGGGSGGGKAEGGEKGGGREGGEKAEGDAEEGGR